MRTDMKKVLTERPRWGSRDCYHQVRSAIKQTEPDDLPSHEGIRRPHHTKEFSDLLGPLKRFLRSSVGRRYDDVWSELCANVPGHTTTGAHLRDHARRECEKDVVIIDGEVLCRSAYGPPREPRGLYVDPRDGLIYYKQQPRPRYAKLVRIDGLAYWLADDGIHYPCKDCWRYQKNGVHPLKLIGEHRAMNIAGIWYWIERRKVPPPITQSYVVDGETRQRVVYTSRHDIITGELVQAGWYYSNKRQLASRDLRRHGLCNTQG